jgi:predicted O-methyltransferase YrrM
MSGSGNVYEFEYDWFSGNTPTIKDAIRLVITPESPLNMVEIGSWEGRSAVWFLENVLTHEDSTLHVIDPWDCPIGETIEARFDHNTGLALQTSPARLIKHKGHSTDVLPTLPASTFDVIFIDGSHLARDVFMDTALAWRLLRPGGVLIWDDYLLEHKVEFRDGRAVPVEATDVECPKMAIDAFLECFEPVCKVIHLDYQIIVQKQ